MAEGASVIDDMSEDESTEFVDSVRLVEWWRQEHAYPEPAYPMLLVAAGLRTTSGHTRWQGPAESR
jgi:hypothetical protein